MKKNWRELISQPKYGMKIEKDVYITMRDGVRLAVNIYRPNAPGKFPALLAIGGYGKELQEELIPPQPLNKSAVWDGNIEAGETPDIVARGYVHVIGDLRGCGQSEGEYAGMWSQQEGRDGHDLIEWIAKQPWCTGKVGMTGYSYYGGAQLKTAIQQPPHLKSIFVSHVGADFYRDFVYAGGVLSLFFYGLWDGRHGTSGFAPKNAVSLMEKSLSKKEFERRRNALLDHPDIKNFPNVYHCLKYPYKNPWFFDMVMNPLDGPFWQDKSIYPFFDKIKIPVFVVGKCGHEASGFWDVYFGIKSSIKRLLVKPSGQEERPWREDHEMIIRWHDHWLKGNDTGMLEEPTMKIYMQGINQWRYEEEWPIKGTKWTNCYLRRWEGLSFAPELYQNEPDCFVQQPLHVSAKRDSVQYVSPPMPENMELIGPVALNISASLDQDDTTWIAKLYDVDTQTGKETRITKGYLRASHRALDKKKSKPYSPYQTHVKEEPVTPGKIYEYSIGLGIISAVIKKDHRIKLTIESLESARDPEMQIHYHPHLCSGRTTLHKIYHYKENQSYLVLPIVKPNPVTIEMLSDDNLI
jgi:uncharacterized protein